MTNLSIGLNCVLGVNIKASENRLKGSHQSLYVMTKFNNSRFEFIFSSAAKNSGRLFKVTVNSFKNHYHI